MFFVLLQLMLAFGGLVSTVLGRLLSQESCLGSVDVALNFTGAELHFMGTFVGAALEASTAPVFRGAFFPCNHKPQILA